MYDKLNSEFKKARLEKNNLVKDLLSTLKGEIDTEYKDYPKHLEASDLDLNSGELNILTEKKVRSFIKNINKCMESDTNEERLANYSIEKSVLSSFLPKELTRDEIINTLKVIGIDSLPDFGKKMAIAKATFGNEVDGKLLSEIIRNEFN